MPIAESIAVVASVIAIIQISEKVIGSCKFYLEAASDTPSELRRILVEISTLKSVLEILQFLGTCEHASPALWKQLSEQNGPIEECKRSTIELEKLFPSDIIPVARSHSGAPRNKRRKVGNVYATLAWPFKAPKARELLQTIIQQKTMISLALTADSSQDIKSIKKDTTEIRNMLTDSQRQDIYRWLEKTDPSPIHNRSWKLHEQETGNWVLRSNDWQKWLAGDTRCLWIHGIPGAGKTVLTSFLVEQLKEYCWSRKKTCYSYYYCYFGHNQEEASPFLSWTISQICRRTESIPTIVFELFRQGGQPSHTELLKALEACLECLDLAYIVLDAADESKPREDLLKVLRDLATDTRFSKIKCIVTSREYIDIEKSMESISSSLPMSNKLVDEDIRKYARSILDSKPRFQTWPADLRAEVEEAVVNGSKGMFRWTVCQLDRLQRLKCDRRIIKNALATLPKTLDETYERILTEIPRDEWPFVHHALQWIRFHQLIHDDNAKMSLQLLLAATETSVSSEIREDIDIDFDGERLRNMLGCLINVNEGCVFLAHYTVKEYLESPRIAASPTGYFWSGDERMIKERMQIILQGAQAIDWTEEKCELLKESEYLVFLPDFAVYCAISGAMSFEHWGDAIASDKLLLSLAADLLNPFLSHFDSVGWAIESHGKEFYDYQNLSLSSWRLPEWKVQPDCIEAAILLNILLLLDDSSLPIAAAFSEGKEIDSIAQSEVHFSLRLEGVYYDCEGTDFDFDGSLFGVMAQLSRHFPRSFNWLLDKCNAAINTEVMVSVIETHCYLGLVGYQVLKKILSGQVDLNAKGYRVTPLQIAAANSDIDGVTQLLEAGADPNATGNQNGIFFKTRSLLEKHNLLHGLSPLHICRSENLIRDWGGKRQVVEEILLRHGAKEFQDI